MADSPVSINTPGSAGEAPAGPSPQEQKQMEQAYAQMKRKMAMEEIGRKIKHKIMVLSGKGGVGKSTVSTGLALSLAQQGHTVGILDIDITGPNVPKMMGLDGRRLHVENKRIHPAQGHLGVKVISMAFLLEDEDTPVVWRGPIKLGAIQQFIGDVEWGELDYLIIDFPPGTSDEPLTVAQSLPDIDGMVIVTTPQQVALLDSRKSITFSESLKVPVLGVVENMSAFIPPDRPDCRYALFGSGGGAQLAADYDVPLLAQIPMEMPVQEGGDTGRPIVINRSDSASAAEFKGLAEAVIKGVTQPV